MTRSPHPLAALAAVALAGCASDFVPESYLRDLRVLAIVAEPPEAGPGEAVTLTPTVYAPPGDPVASTAWRFCPITLGASTGYACALPACEVALEAAPDGSVTQEPTALALACLEQLAAAPPPGFEPGEVPATVETVFRLRVESVGGEVREAVRRVPLHTQGPPPARNRPPIIDAVELGGAPAGEGATLAPGARLRLTVRVDPASLEAYVDGNGRTLTEAVTVWFYATAGRLDDVRGAAPVAETDLVAEELEPDQDEALVWVVARDLRGGEAVAGPFTVTLTR